MATKKHDAEADPQRQEDWIVGEVKWNPFKARIIGKKLDCGHSAFVIKLFRQFSGKKFEQIGTIHERDIERFAALIRECQDEIRLIRTQEMIDG